MAILKVWNGTGMVPVKAFSPLAVTTTNVGNAYSVTIPGATYTDGQQISVKFNAASTGAITINVNSLGVKAVVDYFGNAVTNVRANLIANLAYEATSGNFILQGKGGGGNATAAQLLAGATATTDAGQITGTMPNKGAVTITPSASSQAIPLGYHNGSGSVPAVSVPAANVLTGTTIAGTTGTMANNGAYNITPSSSAQAIPAGYHNGSGVVSAITPPPTLAAGDMQFFSDPTTYSFTILKNSMVQKAAFTVKYSGVVRCKATLTWGPSAGSGVTYQIYKNGTAVGTRHYITSGSLACVDDISVVAGDIIQFYTGNDDGYNANGSISNISLCIATGILATKTA